MKLYVFPLSPNARKAMIVAAHAGVPVENVLVDLTKKESRTPEFLAINPNGKVPALVDGDFVLWESNAIIQYIAGKKPNGLWPEDARTRADIARWQFWQASQWNEGIVGLTVEHLLKPMRGGAPDPDAVRRAEEAFHRDAKVLDAHLAGRKYLVGDALTLADISVGVYLMYAGPAKMPLEPYGNVKDWFARLQGLPAWQQTEPPRRTS